MPQLLWDASALTKRYAPEAGSGMVHALMGAVPPVRMVGTYLGYAETAASLRRKFNQGVLNVTQFDTARSFVEAEVLNDLEFELLTVDDAAILSGISLVDQYNLNATDAAVLVAYLRYAGSQTPDDPVCLLIASDQRLLRAAIAEGLGTLNPETVAATDLSGLLAGA